MKITKKFALEKYQQCLDFISGYHFGEPGHWEAKLPVIDNLRDVEQSMMLEKRYCALKAPVSIFYNLLPKGIFYSLAITVAVLGFLYPVPNNPVLFAIALGLVSMPYLLTMGDYQKFTNSLNIARRFRLQGPALKYVDEAQGCLAWGTEGVSAKIASIESMPNIRQKKRENYGVVPLALLENLIRWRSNYDRSALIAFSDSGENLRKIDMLAKEVGCKPENIRTELENFKNIGSLLLQPSKRLANCLKYIRQIKKLPEYSSNESFKAQTDSLYKKLKNQISKNRI